MFWLCVELYFRRSMPHLRSSDTILTGLRFRSEVAFPTSILLLLILFCFADLGSPKSSAVLAGSISEFHCFYSSSSVR